MSNRDFLPDHYKICNRERFEIEPRFLNALERQLKFVFRIVGPESPIDKIENSDQRSIWCTMQTNLGAVTFRYEFDKRKPKWFRAHTQVALSEVVDPKSEISITVNTGEEVECVRIGYEQGIPTVREYYRIDGETGEYFGFPLSGAVEEEIAMREFYIGLRALNKSLIEMKNSM